MQSIELQQHDVLTKSEALDYRMPDVATYEQKKGLIIAGNRPRSCRFSTTEPICKPSFSPEYERTRLTESNFSYAWLFKRRLESLLGLSQEMVNLYPGPLIPQPGTTKGFVNRGTLYREQYSFFSQYGWFPDAGATVHICAAKKKNPWVWWHITQPQLRYIESTDVATNHEKIKSLHFSCDASEIEFSLQQIHSLWDHEPPSYSSHALALCRPWLPLVMNISGEKAWQAFFELEACASFLTYCQDLPVIFTGSVCSNWLAVFRKPLNSIRQTEMCDTNRIVDELLDLDSASFAPMVVNEYDTVTDGNHRLVAAWIWNVLKYCRHLTWDIRSTEFQESIRSAVICTQLLQNPVTLHEVLYHLGFLLSRQSRVSELEVRLKPRLNKAIDVVPVVFVPEYLCCAVYKHQYDAGTEVRRIHPTAFRAIAQAPGLVLPVRASYHYTDCVLLPWFKVVQ